MKSYAAFLVICGFLLAGCSSGGASTDGHPSLAPMHRQDVDETLADNNISDKAREILSDYWVTDEEWNEMVNDYQACMVEQGTEGYTPVDHLVINVTKSRMDQINREITDPTEAMAQLNRELDVAWDCALDNITTVGLHYFNPRNNPAGVSWQEAIQRCYQEAGIGDLDGRDDAAIEEFLNTEGYHRDDVPDRGACHQNPSYTE